MTNGKCYHHPSQDAVAQCKKCGKLICEDCYNVYGVSDGGYAGEALCYDCTEQLVAANVKAIASFKSKTIITLVIIGIGAMLGGIIGGSSGGGGLGVIIGIGLGGSLNIALKALWLFMKGAFIAGSRGTEGMGIMMQGFFMVLISPIKTIQKIASVSWQIKKANDILVSDSQALREMRDYFAYTQAMENNGGGVDLTRLTEQDGELFENTYARAILERGEEVAQQELRQRVVQIAANGEIIRGFNPEEKPKKKEDIAA